ncbi:hypothetical protein ACWERA_35670, partial [Streptomyces mirabilis]
MSADTPQGMEHSLGNNVSVSLSDDDRKLRADRSRHMLVTWTYAPVTFSVAPQWGAWPPGPVWLCAPCRTDDLGG